MYKCGTYLYFQVLSTDNGLLLQKLSNSKVGRNFYLCVRIVVFFRRHGEVSIFQQTQTILWFNHQPKDGAPFQ